MAPPAAPEVGSIFGPDLQYNPPRLGVIPVPVQPGGPGSQVTLPVQQPNQYWRSQGIPTNTPPDERDGSMMLPCGHSTLFYDIISVSDADGIPVAVCRCPLCQYVVLKFKPFNKIFDPQVFVTPT